MNNILHESHALRSQLEEDYKYLHAHAEVGFELRETSAYVERQLAAIGCQPERCGTCGITALIGDSSKGKCILLRADMDALPMPEQSACDFSCTNGSMHSCGHDMHTAMLLGAARILKAHEHELGGSVKLMFQPAEEILAGAADMIEGGILSDPAPACGVMIHVIPGINLPVGSVIVPPAGIGAPAANYFTISVSGAGCHGSSPSEGVDALNCAAHILIALNEIPARELAVSERAVLTIGSLTGCDAANVIPDKVVMRGTLRSFDENVRERIKDRIIAIAGSIAAAFRAHANVTFDSGCPTLINSAELCELAEATLCELLGDKNCITAEKLSRSGGIGLGGSEDFSYISHNIPSLMLALPAGRPEDGFAYGLHHSKVQFDQSALPIGCAVYAQTAISILN